MRAVLCYLVMLTGCAQLARPGIVNERLKGEGEEIRQQAAAIREWKLCMVQYRGSWTQDPKEASVQPINLELAKLGALHVCGPYPGHGFSGWAAPDEKGMNLLHFDPSSLPILGVVFGAMQ